MRSRVPLAIAALVVLSGCASGPTGPDGVRGGAASVDAMALINLWRVTEADGSGADAFLRLDASELMVWTDCGRAMGSWRAADTAFLADVSVSSGGAGCLSDPASGTPAESLEWLYAASAFSLTESGAELLGTDGEVVAVLSVDGVPPANADHTPDYLEAPEATVEDAARFVSPAPLPFGVRSVGADDLGGRWDWGNRFSAERPFVEFADNGTWSASDGCNEGRGRWAFGDGGVFLATSGVSTLMACDGAAVPSWVSGAARVGLAGSRLVFMDAAGAELGRLTRG